ncbi:unnamed protein product [Schistocephalus solidus]|uniref:Kelch-like protein 10 n=1 Tax=Schistocephalus solidus TaxID=70667 RepID=A0A183SL61_SCHSO|nr:unnamed protein product [Schistocephalus solidus]
MAVPGSSRSANVGAGCENLFLICGQPQETEDDVQDDWRWHIYDPVTEKSVEILSTLKRKNASVVAIKSFVYVLGGRLNGVETDSVEEINVISRHVGNMSPMAFTRANHCATMIGNTIIVCGGYSLGSILCSCELFLPLRNRWVRIPNMQGRRASASVVSLPDGRVFVIGGFNEQEVLDSVEFCLPTEDAFGIDDIFGFWRMAAPMPSPRYGQAGVTIDGKIIVAGGVFGCIENTVSMFTPPNSLTCIGQWTMLKSMRQCSYHIFLVATASKIFAFGTLNERFCLEIAL